MNSSKLINSFINHRRFTSTILLLVTTFYTVCPQSTEMKSTNETEIASYNEEQTKDYPQKRIPGEKINKEEMNRIGYKSFFRIQEIDAKLFQRIYKKSYKEDCTIPKEDLRYLTVLHYNLNQEICLGELICNKKISTDLLNIFQTLFEAKYPIARMVLIDEYNADDEASMRANNTSCFNFRRVAGTNVLSNHSKGLAIDINPLYNPFVKQRKGKTLYQPSTAKQYINRNARFPYKIDHNDLCYKLFKHYGFTWGGDWRSLKDFQHFEKNMK